MTENQLAEEFAEFNRKIFNGITLTMPWPPSVNKYWRTFQGRMIISAEGRSYRKAVADLKAKGRPTYEGTGGGENEEHAPASDAGYKKKKKGNGKGGKAPEQ